MGRLPEITWWVLLVAVAGCASSQSAFVGQAGSVSVVGSTPTYLLGPPIPPAETYSVDLRVANHGTDPIQMNYFLDRYTAKLTDGRTVELDKPLVTSYPQVLNPGYTLGVSVGLPPYVKPQDVENITVVTDAGRLSVEAARTTPAPAGAGAPDR